MPKEGFPSIVRVPQPLSNRKASDGAFMLPRDGYYHWTVKGVIPNRHPLTREPILQVVDDEAIARIIANAEADGVELLVDKEHDSHQGRDTAAYGWASPEGLQAREEGLFGRIRLTDLGNAAVKGGNYRYISPVFEWESVEDLGNGRYRPTRILDLGLTNRPNCETIKALSNRGGAREFGEEPTREDMSENNKKAGDGPSKPPAEVSEVMTLRNRVAELEGELQTLRNSEADAVLEQYGVSKDSPGRAGLRTLLLTNREEGVAVLKALSSSDEPAAKEEKPPVRLFNKSEAKQPGVKFTGKDTGPNLNLLNRRAEELRAQGMKWDRAWNQAQNEMAEENQRAG